MVNLKELSTEKIKEMSLIDLCYAYMIEEGIERLNIYDFLDYIKPLRNAGDEEFDTQAAYFYTDLNLDGRFVCVEDGSWKLRDSLLVEDIKKLDNVNYNTKVEIEFTLKDKKISKVETRVEANNFLKVETSSELKYGNAKVESLKYNEGAISDQESTIKNITTKATMQLLSLPLAQKLMRNVQSGLGQ